MSQKDKFALGETLSNVQILFLLTEPLSDVLFYDLKNTGKTHSWRRPLRTDLRKNGPGGKFATGIFFVHWRMCSFFSFPFWHIHQAV
jgi:hypothetical protein